MFVSSIQLLILCNKKERYTRSDAKDCPKASFAALYIARCRLSHPSPGVFRHALPAGDSAAGHPPKTSINPALVKTEASFK
jgi:hypothetical protein